MQENIGAQTKSEPNSALTLPVFSITRHRLATDGNGVSTLVGAYGCPLTCRYCLNPHAWNPETLKRCTHMTANALYEKVKIDELYFLATGGGITFGGGEALLHAEFFRSFRSLCGPKWTLTAETSLNVPEELLRDALSVIDDFIIDIKDLNPAIYEAYTGLPIDRMLSNLKLLAEHIAPEHVFIRVPAIPDYNTKADLAASVDALKAAGFTQIEVFPYIIRNIQVTPSP